MANPDPMTIIADPATSFWLKRALRDALDRDPLDAANDAAILYEVLVKRKLFADGTICPHCEQWVGIIGAAKGLCGCDVDEQLRTP